MINRNVLIPGIFIERKSDNTVYQIQTTIDQAVVLRNISTDSILIIPLATMNLCDYEVVSIEPSYMM